MDILRTSKEEEQQWDLQNHPLRGEIKWLFLTALIVFILTVGIGILNGQRVITLSHDVLLTHVHAGTIGWITLSVFATSLILFGDSSSSVGRSQYLRWLSIVAAIAIPAYVLTFFSLAFLSSNSLAVGYVVRAVFAVPALLVMIAFLGWIAARSSQMRLGIPQLALLGALITLVIGASVGVLLQVQFATNVPFLPPGAFGAHPSSLTSGYLVLVGMAIIESRLQPSIARLGIVQIVMFFLAGLVLGTALLLNIPPLIGLNTLLVVIGAIFFIIRYAGRVARTSWLKRSSTRFFALGALFLLVNTCFLVYLTVSIITGRIAPDRIPEMAGGLLLALDHSIFVGVMTNVLFGLIRDMTGERRALWPWADEVLFWGLNIGLAGFLFALVSEMRGLERIFTPIMGLSILLGIIVYVVRLLPARPSAAASKA